jgi:fucose permease
VLDRHGFKPALTLGPLLVALALVILGRAGSPAVLRLGAFWLGAGGALLNASTNTLAADLFDEERAKAAALNRLGIFFGIGALFLPFLLGAVEASLRFLDITAVLCVAVSALALAQTFPAPKQAAALALSAVPLRLRDPAIAWMAALLFFQSGNEFLLGGFLSSYLTQVTGVTVEVASRTLALYWLAVIVARAGLGRWLPRFVPQTVLVVSGGLSALACALLPAAGTLPAAAATIALIGLAMASIFPIVLGLAAARDPAHSGTVVGVLLTVALSGGMSWPWIGGQVGATWGLRAVAMQAAAGFTCITMIAVILQRRSRTA